MKKITIAGLLLICAMLFCACGSQSVSNSERAATVDSAGEKYYIIETPYAKLRVTEDFDKNIAHKESGKEPYVLTFSSKKDDTELFSIVFNGKEIHSLEQL